jgi:hypothetical protein
MEAYKKELRRKQGKTMKEYLGEKIVDISTTEFANYKPVNWALTWIENFNVDGAHHKDWLIDQIARILCNTEVIVKLAKWGDGTEEYRFTLGEPTFAYNFYIESMKKDGIEHSIGIAP